MKLNVFCFMFLFVIMTEAEEYCQSEIFRPSCLQDEVILISKAHYGRMKFGKCVKEEQQFKSMWNDPQYLGCSTDVLAFVSKHCTGKSNCQLKISDPDLEKYGPCYASLKMYLDVSYTCIKVAKNNRQCTITLESYGDIHVMRQQQEEGCGTKRQPWIVETMKGQTISVNSMTSDDDLITSQRRKINCPDNEIEGYILDKLINKNITICSHFGRIPYQYNSTSHVIEIVVLHKTDGGPLFLKLRATGCTDLIPPADAWLKRTENEATIGCYSTRLRWQLKCLGQRWIGVIGNCSYATINNEKFNVHLVEKPFEERQPQVVAVVIICIVGITLCTVISCFGIVCFKRYNAKSKLATKLFHQRQSTLRSQNDNLKTGLTCLENGIPEMVKSGLPLYSDCELGQDGKYQAGNNQYFVLDSEYEKKDLSN